MTTDNNTNKEATSEIEKLLQEKAYNSFPKVGDVVHGKVIAVGRNEVRMDIGGLAVGLVRGPELDPQAVLAVGDEIDATVIDLDNEFGELELSLKGAGRKKTWEKIKELYTSGTVVNVRILEANKGGLIVRLEGVSGFLPVSQLSPENYPRVQGGEKSRILEKLKDIVGKDLDVKVIDVNEEEGKYIVSEKAVWETKQESVISKYKIGDTVEGTVTAVTDFGAFVKFDANLEG
ncbi:MAG: S1 RNA-binding domain-containing protein, partial [Patescibacteria group bacterium]